MQLFIIAIIMIVFGLLGGLANYYTHAISYDINMNMLTRSLLFGVIASVLVPVFFQITQSRVLDDLLDRTQDDNAANRQIKQKSYLVFSAVCLVAAFSGLPFISSIGDEVLSKRIDSVGLAVKVNTAKIDSTAIINKKDVVTLAKSVRNLQTGVKSKGIKVEEQSINAVDSLVKQKAPASESIRTLDTMRVNMSPKDS